MLKNNEAESSEFKRFVDLVPEMFPMSFSHKMDVGMVVNENIEMVYKVNIDYICEHHDAMLVKLALEFRSLIKSFVNFNTYNQYSKKSSRRELIIYQLFIFYLLANQRFLDSNYSMETAAKELGVNKNLLSGAINKCTGYSFITIINKYRIAYAQYLISRDLLNKVNFEEIAFNTGFNNRTTFYRVFIEVTGKIPSEFRQQYNGSVYY